MPGFFLSKYINYVSILTELMNFFQLYYLCRMVERAL